MPTEGKNYLHAFDLYRLLTKLQIEEVHLVGLSLGSFVALDFLALFPGNIHSVSVASGAIYADENDTGIKEPKQLVTDTFDYKREWFEHLLTGCGPLREHYESKLRDMVFEWNAWQVTNQEPECLIGHVLIKLLRKYSVNIPISVYFAECDFKGAHRSSEESIFRTPDILQIWKHRKLSIAH
jgi:3-oxoadipate enol-lactonase